MRPPTVPAALNPIFLPGVPLDVDDLPIETLNVLSPLMGGGDFDTDWVGCPEQGAHWRLSLRGEVLYATVALSTGSGLVYGQSSELPCMAVMSHEARKIVAEYNLGLAHDLARDNSKAAAEAQAERQAAGRVLN